MEAKRILVINPGSTGTKLAIFRDKQKEAEELSEIEGTKLPLVEQVPERIGKALEFLKQHGDSPLSAVVGRRRKTRTITSPWSTPPATNWWTKPSSSWKST